MVECEPLAPQKLFQEQTYDEIVGWGSVSHSQIIIIMDVLEEFRQSRNVGSVTIGQVGENPHKTRERGEWAHSL